ncbi:MAG: MmoB/DmpM family protein [Hyphomicrobiales bacterium]
MVQIASITLLHNDEARPIIEAILADNPGTRVLNMPGAVKLDRDETITVNRVRSRSGSAARGAAGDSARARLDGRQPRRGR